MTTLRSTVPNLSLAILTIVCVSGCRSVGRKLGKEEVIFLGKEKDHYFGLFAGHHPAFIELGKNGTYRKYLGTSTGETFLDDEGKWNQDAHGVVTIRAKGALADVIAGPLTVFVGSSVYIEYLPKVKAAIIKYLGNSSADSFTVRDEPELGILDGHTMDVQLVGFWKEGRPTHFTRAQLEALLEAIDSYLEDSSLRNRRVKPFRYRKQSFLLSLNHGLARDWDLQSAKRAVDKGYLMRCFVGVSEQDFKEAIAPPVPRARSQDDKARVEQESPADAGQ